MLEVARQKQVVVGSRESCDDLSEVVDHLLWRYIQCEDSMII